MYKINTHKSLSENIYSGTSSTLYDIPSWLPKANFSRTQYDLVAISPNGEEIVFIDYFTNFELPSIQTTNGLLLNGSLLKALAGPLAKGQYAQAAGDAGLSIGEVSSVSGVVKATRLDGNVFDLNTGDPVFQGDTIETEGSGAVGLVFLDKTTLSLSDGGKMVLDELIYDPNVGTGNMAVKVVEGAFSFISGEIAKTGPDAMTLETPVVTMGIRGTTVAGKAAVEGNENSFTLLQDADGGVGQISISNDGGTQVLSQVGATTSVSSFTAPPPPPIILSAAQIQANYGTALNVLPPTPAVAPQPQPAPPPQEEQQEQQVQEEASEESEEEAVEEEVAEEGEAEGEGEGEEGLAEGEEGPPEGEEGLAEGEEGPPEGEEGPPEGEEGSPSGPPEADSVAEESLESEAGPATGSESEEGPGGEPEAARQAFDTALAAGASPEEAMAEAAEAAGFDGPPPGGSLSEPTDGPLGSGPGGPGAVIPGDPSLSSALIPGTTGFSGPNDFGSPLATVGPMNAVSGPMIGPSYGMGPMGGTGLGGLSMDSMGGQFAPGDMMLGVTGLADPMGGILGPSPFGPVGEYGNSTVEPVVEFFEDPSLYDDYQRNQQTQPMEDNSSNAFLINGLSDFGSSISNFSLSETITINFTFDEPVSTHSVTRSAFYEYTSTASQSSLLWDSKPSTIAQTVAETEPNGAFSNAQVISRARFKGGVNNDVADGTLHWSTITGGWINRGVDLFKVDLQEGETLIIDIDYGDSYSDSINTYVTLYNSSQVSVAENDDSATTLGGGGSSGTGDSYISYTSTTTETFTIFVEDSPKNNNSSTAGDFVVNLSITPTSSSTGLGTTSTSAVGGNNKLPYLFNFTENTSNYNTKSFKSDVVSQIKYTDSTSGSGSEVFFVVRDGTNSAIWLWDDLSEGYGVSDNELTLVATIPNFDNDTLTGSK